MSSSSSLPPSRRPLRLAALLTLIAFAGCTTPSSDGPLDGEPVAPHAAATSGDDTPVAVAHRDTRTGRPTFAWASVDDAVKYESAEASALGTLRRMRTSLRMAPEALTALGKPTVHDTGNGPLVARFAPHVGGREIFRGQVSVLMKRDFSPVAVSGLLGANVTRLDADSAHTVSAPAALEIAYRKMTGHALEGVRELGTQDEYRRFDAPGFQQVSRVKEVFFPQRDGLESAFRVEILLDRGGSRSYVISAVDGRVLFDNDLVHAEAFTYRTWASPETKIPFDGPQGNDYAPRASARPDGSKPSFVPTQTVTLESFPFSKNDPWLPPGSTVTTGNNVDAYADLASPNGFAGSTADLRADVTAAGTFDRAYDTTRSPNATPDAIKASTTHLFYTLNFMHDWFYDAGWDEKSGNPQVDNFGRGGKGGDRLLGEAQDYSGRNNANASTPADGASPRIQMYVFAGQTTASLTVNAPAGIAGKKNVGVTGGFGKDLFDLTGPVVLAADSGTDPADACENLSNGAQVTGKIVLAHRGNCSFLQKAQKAQAAGASGIVIANVASSASPGTAPFMGGTALDVTIPALSLNLADGQALEAAIAQGANVTLKREGTVDLDGALDTSIVAHEWGHVLSNRLIADGDGLNTNQAGGLGEGWSDFVALLAMARADDLQSPLGANWGGIYPTGSYATSGGGDDAYFGIRRMPYSVDFTKNGLTFKHIADGNPLPANVPSSFGEDGSNNSEVHNTGEVWASMLWECYVALLRDTRFTFPEAQERMKRTLVAALKLTPADPTLLEARDALLAAAFANDEKDFALFWQAFARRGAGVGATGPGKESFDNKGVKESFSVGNDLEIVSAELKDDRITCDRDGILDEGEVGTLELTVRNSGAGTLTETKARLVSKSAKVSFDGGDGRVPLAPLKPFQTQKLALKVGVEGNRPLSPIEIDVQVDDPTLAVPRTITLTVPARRDADEVADSSDKDEVETTNTSWQVTAKDATGSSQKWHRVRFGNQQYWSIPNAGEPSDHRLISPIFAVKGQSFGLSYRHRWAFESDDRRKKDFDGGVVEISIDGGKTWKDASEYGDVDYNVTLDNDAQGSNPLKGRRAYGRTSEGYPDKWVTSNLTLTLDAPSTDVALRFRAGADDNTGEAGWDVDDIALTGIDGKPFWSLVAHRDLCDAAGPRVNAGENKTVRSGAQVALTGTGTHPKNAALTFAWTQVDGPALTLAGTESATLSFVAPKAETPPRTYTFALRANDGALLSPASRVTVTVDDSAGPDTPLPAISGGGCGCHSAGNEAGSGLSSLAIAGAVMAVVRRRRRDRA